MAERAATRLRSGREDVGVVSKTQYVRGPEGHVAYQVLGEGPTTIVFLPDHPTNLEIMWEEPSVHRFLTRLASIGRLICFDKRGVGVSDPVPLGALPTLEEWTDDILTVIDAVGCERVALFGHGDGGKMSMVFAATYPDRTTALVLADAYARFVRAPDYEHGLPAESLDQHYAWMCATWGTGAHADRAAPSLADDAAYREWLGRYQRLSMSPGEFAAMYPATVFETDVRSILSSIRVPTLVLHRARNSYIRVGHGRYLAEQIRGARYVELDGEDYFFNAGDSEAMLRAVREFLTGEAELAEEERVLATVLFTDIVGSTERAQALGDSAWRDVLERHHAIVRRELARCRGREVNTTGDGFLAAFDGPARAVRCALAIRDAVRGLDLEIRAGLHTGECERIGGTVGGIAVHIGARVVAAAGPGEVLVSRTVTDLVAGSGLHFTPIGTRVLKGIPGEWELFAAR